MGTSGHHPAKHADDLELVEDDGGSRGDVARSFGQAAFDRPSGELDPVVQLKLAQRVLNVVLHCAMRDDQALGDLPRGAAGRHHPQDLDLPFGQHCRGRRLVAGDAPILPEHERGQAGGERRIARGGTSYRLEQLRPPCRLHEIAACTDLDRGQHVAVLAGRGEHEDADAGVLLDEFRCCLHAGDAWQLQIHQHDVRAYRRRDAYRALAVAHCADDLVAGAGEIAFECVAPDGVVVDDHHSNRHRRSSFSGRTISTSVPPPGADVIVAFPPRVATRRRIEPVTPNRPSASAASSRPSAMPTPSSRTVTRTRSSRRSSSTHEHALGPACCATLVRAARTAAASSLASVASTMTGSPGTETVTRSPCSIRSSPARSSRPGWVLTGRDVNSARSAVSCSAAAAPSSAQRPPASRPARCTSPSTCSTPSWIERESRSRSATAAWAAAATARSRSPRTVRAATYPVIAPVNTSSRPLVSVRPS